ncbi:MAG: ABC transporter ATP-binding protein [Planctomycetota bacterium]|jgi:putative ABC transport system ATP-binding protein
MLVNTTRLIRNFRLDGGALVEALRGVHFTAESGEIVGILGKSGSGKSTLLNLIGGLDRPTRGLVEVADLNLHALPPKTLALFRLKTVGFVFQSFNLSPTLRAWENVSLPLVFAGVPRLERKKRALQLLDSVGLSHRKFSRPGQMSAGEQQRTAIARAIVNAPRLLLADEPTGNLDTATSEEIMKLLVEQNRKGMTIVMVTHDPDLAARYAARTVRMADGRIVGGEDGRQDPETPAEEGGKP